MFGVKNAAISIKYFAARSGSGATIYINDRPVPLLAGENPEYQSPLSPMTCKVFGEYFLIGDFGKVAVFGRNQRNLAKRSENRYACNYEDTFLIVVVYSQKCLVSF